MFKRLIIHLLLLVFASTSVFPQRPGLASEIVLPPAGKMLSLSPNYTPDIVMGIKVSPRNPLLFSFLVKPGQDSLSPEATQDEYLNLVKYFLASLTTAEKDMWVNLSPYERDHMITPYFANTQMGRDMLVQDYILKQLSASLIYPEQELGKKFWSLVYKEGRNSVSSSSVSVNALRKIWIVPGQVTIYEKGNVALIVKSHLRVMMKEEERNGVLSAEEKIVSQKIRDLVLPKIEQEINTGKNFSQLRQMFHSMVLAAWFKQRLKKHVLNAVYVNQNKVEGIKLQDPQANQRIYEQYIQAFKKGAFNYIKDEQDVATGKIVPRKYFSGGTDWAALATPIDEESQTRGRGINVTSTLPSGIGGDEYNEVTVGLNTQGADAQATLPALTKEDFFLNPVEIKRRLEIYGKSSRQDARFALEQLLKYWNPRFLDNPEFVIEQVEMLSQMHREHGLGRWDLNSVAQEYDFIKEILALYFFQLDKRKSPEQANYKYLLDKISSILNYGAQNGENPRSISFAFQLAAEIKRNNTAPKGFVRTQFYTALVDLIENKARSLETDDEKSSRIMLELEALMLNQNIVRAEVISPSVQTLIKLKQEALRLGVDSIQASTLVNAFLRRATEGMVAESLSRDMGIGGFAAGGAIDSVRLEIQAIAHDIVALHQGELSARTSEQIIAQLSLAQKRIREIKSEFGTDDGDRIYIQGTVYPNAMSLLNSPVVEKVEEQKVNPNQKPFVINPKTVQKPTVPESISKVVIFPKPSRLQRATNALKRAAAAVIVWAGFHFFKGDAQLETRPSLQAPVVATDLPPQAPDFSVFKVVQGAQNMPQNELKPFNSSMINSDLGNSILNPVVPSIKVTEPVTEVGPTPETKEEVQGKKPASHVDPEVEQKINEYNNQIKILLDAVQKTNRQTVSRKRMIEEIKGLRQAVAALEKRPRGNKKDPVGGIDFDPSYLQMNIQGSLGDVVLPQEMLWLKTFEIKGFYPKILAIRSGAGSSLSFFDGVL